jgi:hypothetical protein
LFWLALHVALFEFLAESSSASWRGYSAGQFMVTENLLDPRFSSKSIIEMHRRSTRHHEYVADPVRGELADYIIRNPDIMFGCHNIL